MTSTEETELVQIRKELERVKEEYRSFLYTVSHDLSAPIRHINSFSEIILAENSDKFDDRSRQYFGFITRAGEDLAAMLSGLLELSRLNTQQSDFEAVDTDAVISDVMQTSLHEEIEAQQARISCRNMPVISADPGQMKILFTCLLSNSLKFVSDGAQPEITVEAVEAHQHWTFTIADNGIGIDSKHCETVFDVFKKAVDPSQYSGSGVGLTIARKIVDRHGGSVSIAPREGSGAIVTVQIAKSGHDAG